MGRHEVAVVCGDDDSLRIELIGKFIAEAEPMVAMLSEFVCYYEVRAVNQLAYTLATLAANAGTVDLQGAASRLEAASAPTCTRTPTSIILEAELTAVSHALERLRVVRRSWWTRAIRQAQSLRREIPRATASPGA